MKRSNSMSTARSTARAEPVEHDRRHAAAGFAHQLDVEIGPVGLGVAAVGQHRAVEREAQHAFDVGIGEPVDAAGVVEEVGVLGAVRVDRLAARCSSRARNAGEASSGMSTRPTERSGKQSNAMSMKDSKLP